MLSNELHAAQLLDTGQAYLAVGFIYIEREMATIADD
jgi:hypothetical protein